MRFAILAHDVPEANLIVHDLLYAFPSNVVGIVRSDMLIPGKNRWQCWKFLARRMGPDFLLHKGLESVVARFASAYLSLTLRRPRVQTLRQLSRRYRVPLITVRSVNGQTALAQLRRWQPELIACVYVFQLLKLPLIGLPACGVINVHPALLPRNRGLLPYVWALANGDIRTGATVHYVNEKLDEGDVILQREISIASHDTAFAVAYRSAQAGGELIVDAVRQIAAGTAPRTPQDLDQASYFSWPNRVGLRRLENRGHRFGSLREMWREFTRTA